MPKTELMKWEGAPAYRWVKMYRGERLRITAVDLGFDGYERTDKRYSLDAANEWFRAQVAQRTLNPVHPLLAAMRQQATAIGVAADDPRIEEIFNKNQKMIRVREKIAPKTNGAKAIIDEAVWQVLDSIDDEAAVVAHDKTCKGVVDRFIGLRLTEAHSGQRSIAGFESIRQWLAKFVEFQTPDFDMAGFNDLHWERFYIHVSGKLAAKTWSDSYSRDILGTARKLVIWAARQKICPRPESIDDYRVKVDDPEVIKTFTISEVKTCLAAATGQSKLHLLLMLNLGNTQIDINDLKKHQVDLKAGTITRKRSKTRGKKTVPIVCYKLWPETLTELKDQMAKCSDAEFALSTEKGMRWVRRQLKPNGEYSKTDAIASNWKHIQAKTGINKTLRQFRSTSSNLLGDSEHRDMRTLFLGHSNSQLADRRYSNAPNSPLTLAINWLHTKYFGS